MKKIYLVIIILSITKLVYSQAIFGGTPIDISDAPYQVSIELDGEHDCGGTILNCEWILTAGHCAEGRYTTGNIMIHAGATNQTNNSIGQRISVDQVIVHPNFNGTITDGSDLTLLHLASPLEFNENVQSVEYATPNNLPLGELTPGSIVTITGWGDSGNGCCNNNLLSANLPIINNNIADNLLSGGANNCAIPVNSVDNTMLSLFQLGLAAGPGDSGGPAVITISTGEQLVIGASSFGGCPRDDFPTIYANVRNLSQFIDNTISIPGCCFDASEIVINTDQIWTADRTEFNIRILPNVTLTLDGITLEIDKGRIILEDEAKLVVDNSVITSLEACGWQGIQAPIYTNFPIQNQDAEIIVKNNSKIENAITGITASAAVSNIEITTNSSIENCGTGLSLSWFASGATISDAHFLDNEIGISNKISGEISITDTNFKNNTKAGIYANTSFSGNTVQNCYFYNNKKAIHSIDSPLDVKGNNTFLAGEVGIALKGTFPLATSINIGADDADHNLFKLSELGISTYGTESPIGASIHNCQFESISFGSSYFLGANKVDFINNTVISANSGITAFATGDNFNNLNCNSYDQVTFNDNAFLFNNSKTSFLGNESTNNLGHNFGFFGATMKSDIGNDLESASNCFTSNTVDFYTETTWGWPTQSFNYWYWDEPCQVPSNSGGFTTGVSLSYENHCLEGVGVFHLIDPDGDGEEGVGPDHDPDTACKDCVKDSINTWIDIVTIDTTGGPGTGGPSTGGPNTGGPSTGTGGPYSDTDTEAVLDQWINYGLYVALETEDYQFAEDILQPLTAWRWQKRLYGVKILKGNYIEAEQVLNSLSSATQDEIYFKEVQYINLKRLRDIREAQEGRDGTSTVTSAELDQLRFIADSPYSTKGYAHSIYTAITGEDLPINLPDLRGSRRFDSYAIPNNSHINQGYGIFPNPAHDELTISLEGEYDLEMVSLFDITGKKIYHNKHSGKLTVINVNDIKPGIYFISILKSNGEYLNNKIIID